MDLNELLEKAEQSYRNGVLNDAESRSLQILTVDPRHHAANRLLARVLLRQLRFHEALQLLETVIQYGCTADLLTNYGLALHGSGRTQEALENFDRALLMDPSCLPALSNRGRLLQEIGRLNEALADYDRVVFAQPSNSRARNNRGNTLHKLGRYSEAFADFEFAVRLDPHFAIAWNNRGNVLKQLGRKQDATSSYLKSYEVNQTYVEGLCNAAALLIDENRLEQALSCLNQLLERAISHSRALFYRGIVFQRLNQLDEALLEFEKSLASNSRNPTALFACGVALRDKGKYEEALAKFDQLLALNPNHADGHFSRAGCLWEMRRHSDAMKGYLTCLEANPNHSLAFGALLFATMHSCDWFAHDQLASQIEARIDHGSVIPALAIMGTRDNAALHLKAADVYMRHRLPSLPIPLTTSMPRRKARMRIAYLSADFRHHATSMLLVGLIEQHDRSRFEIIGISFDTDDGSNLRERIIRAFDQFIEVAGFDHRKVANLLKELEVDIAIDLNGHTRNSFPEIFSYRPAPIQVNFLGFPGSMGVDFIDYIIADPIVLPFEQQRFFRERIVQLPNCYQPNDPMRVIADEQITRAQEGLPQDAFVFCCFCASWKISASVYDIWMRLLSVTPNSVLWLMRNESAETNLRTAAQRRGVDQERLIFASWLDGPQHLARHRLADLFLDTWPYNAHTTASDALWAGLPLITCRGTTFAARVSASLLEAAGVSELVGESLEEYEAKAAELAHDRKKLDGIRQKLLASKSSCPLFDIVRYTRDIEVAFSRMCEIAQEGQGSRAFRVLQSSAMATEMLH